MDRLLQMIGGRPNNDKLFCDRIRHSSNNRSPSWAEKEAGAVSLYIAHYNLCRVHETIRMTPAMALGVADHIWTIGELIEAATGPQPEGRRVGRFTVIKGGLSQ